MFVCGWKRAANYLDIVEGDQGARDTVWTCREPKPAAANIEDHAAFDCPPVRADRCRSSGPPGR
jgi:uncharacterized protein (DUF427 family)